MPKNVTERAIELTDLTVEDLRWDNALKELLRFREVLSDLFLSKDIQLNRSIGGDFSFSYNNALTSLTVLDGLTSIGEALVIEYNPVLTSLTGLDGLTSIGEVLDITYNPVLTSLAGLNGLTSIGGDLLIGGNNALTSLTGLDNLTSIGGELFIQYNNALTSLSGLDNVDSIGVSLHIIQNDALTSLSGLDNIYPGSITDLSIKYNDSLSTCEVQSICDYLASPNGFIQINNNATGCNSIEEVEASCEAIFVNNITNDSKFFIFPNPSSTHLTIESSGLTNQTYLTILNLKGQELITHQITEPKMILDISNLPGGVYFVRMTGERTVEVGKMIKQ